MDKCKAAMKNSCRSEDAKFRFYPLPTFMWTFQLFGLFLLVIKHNQSQLSWWHNAAVSKQLFQKIKCFRLSKASFCMRD